MLGLCSSPECPAWELEVPDGRGGEVVTLSLWGDKYDPVRKKKVRLSDSSLSDFVLGLRA